MDADRIETQEAYYEYDDARFCDFAAEGDGAWPRNKRILAIASV